jgi:hypothetical protein
MKTNKINFGIFGEKSQTKQKKTDYNDLPYTDQIRKLKKWISAFSLVVNYLKKNASVDQISTSLGIEVDTVRKVILAQQKIEYYTLVVKSNRIIKDNPDIYEMLENGLEINDIVNQTGVTRQTISKYKKILIQAKNISTYAPLTFAAIDENYKFYKVSCDEKLTEEEIKLIEKYSKKNIEIIDDIKKGMTTEHVYRKHRGKIGKNNVKRLVKTLKKITEKCEPILLELTEQERVNYYIKNINIPCERYPFLGNHIENEWFDDMGNIEGSDINIEEEQDIFEEEYEIYLEEGDDVLDEKERLQWYENERPDESDKEFVITKRKIGQWVDYVFMNKIRISPEEYFAQTNDQINACVKKIEKAIFSIYTSTVRIYGLREELTVKKVIQEYINEFLLTQTQQITNGDRIIINLVNENKLDYYHFGMIFKAHIIFCTEFYFAYDELMNDLKNYKLYNLDLENPNEFKEWLKNKYKEETKDLFESFKNRMLNKYNLKNYSYKKYKGTIDYSIQAITKIINSRIEFDKRTFKKKYPEMDFENERKFTEEAIKRQLKREERNIRLGKQK